MTIFRYVFLSICAVAELLLFLFGLTGFTVGESAPLGMVLAITVGAAAMLLITLVLMLARGRTAAGKEAET